MPPSRPSPRPRPVLPHPHPNQAARLHPADGPARRGPQVRSWALDLLSQTGCNAPPSPGRGVLAGGTVTGAGSAEVAAATEPLGVRVGRGGGRMSWRWGLLFFLFSGGGSGVCGVVGFAWEAVGVVDEVVGMGLWGCGWWLVGWSVGRLWGDGLGGFVHAKVRTRSGIHEEFVRCL